MTKAQMASVAYDFLKKREKVKDIAKKYGFSKKEVENVLTKYDFCTMPSCYNGYYANETRCTKKNITAYITYRDNAGFFKMGFNQYLSQNKLDDFRTVKKGSKKAGKHVKESLGSQILGLFK